MKQAQSLRKQGSPQAYGNMPIWLIEKTLRYSKDSEKEKLDFWWQHTIVNVNIKL